MTKFLLTLLIATTCALTLAAPVVAQKADPLKTTEDLIGVNTNDIVSFQEAYKAARGRYAQMLWTHSAAPKTSTLADNLTAAPTYQTDLKTDDVLTALKLDKQQLCRLRIDQYDGPAGQGYVLTAECDSGTQKLQRSWNFGPETYRHSAAWSEVKDPLR
jgi:hypothetical protein